MSVFAAAVDAIFDDPNIGFDATFTPAGGVAGPVRAIDHTESADIEAFGLSRRSDSKVVELRKSEAPTPRKNDSVTIDETVYVINADPERANDGLVWVCELVAA